MQEKRLKKSMGSVYHFEKKDFPALVKKLCKGFEVIAPVKKDLVRFLPVKDAKEICWEKNAFFPIKEYFFKSHEVLFTFSKKGFMAAKQEEPRRVFLGLRTCDLNAIHHQDLVFIDDARDPYYTAAREHAYLIGYHCDEPPMPSCFCGSLGLTDFHDLMLYDRDDHFLVDVGSEKGKELVEKFSTFFKESSTVITNEEKKVRGADRLKKLDLAPWYDHPDWKKGVDLCLSCTACTAVCPTCYCFEIQDEVEMADVKKGRRVRTWSSCQIPEFTRIAGNFVFRKERAHRFKHRIYHQLQYFKEKYAVTMCVGCGRCIEACPTRIDFVDIINNMK